MVSDPRNHRYIPELDLSEFDLDYFHALKLNPSNKSKARDC